MVETDLADLVVAEVSADVELERICLDDRMVVTAADGPASIELVQLIVVGRVRLHLPVVILRVTRGAPLVAVQRRGRDPARGPAGGGRVERAELIGAHRCADRALGNLLGWAPAPVVAPGRHGETAELHRLRVFA